MNKNVITQIAIATIVAVATIAHATIVRVDHNIVHPVSHSASEWLIKLLNN